MTVYSRLALYDWDIAVTVELENVPKWIRDRLPSVDAMGIRSIAGWVRDTIAGLAAGDVAVAAAGVVTAAGRTLATGTLADFVNVRDHSVKGDGTTDDTAAMLAVAATYSRLYWPPGTYLTTAAIPVPRGATWEGAGEHLSIIKIMTDGIGALTVHTASTEAAEFTGKIHLKGISCWGYAYRNPTQGGTGLMQIGPAEVVTIENCGCIYSRTMSMLARAKIGRAINNKIRYGLRDGINFTECDQVLFSGNDVAYVSDDGLAAHLWAARDASVVMDKQVTMIGNKLRFCLGMKVVGAKNTVIANNNARFCTSYFCYVANDTTTEGYSTLSSVTISDNIFSDLISSGVFGGAYGSIDRGIYVDGGQRNAGSSPYALAQKPMDYNSGTDAIVMIDGNIDYHGSSRPRGAASGVRITGNVLRQTLKQSSAAFSAIGYGTLWKQTGAIDPTFVSNIWPYNVNVSKGIGLTGDFDSIDISGNHIDGMGTGVIFETVDYLQNVMVHDNMIIRCGNGVSIAPSSMKHVLALIYNNLINLDPEIVHPNRTTSPRDGTWASLSGSTGAAIYIYNTSGVIIHGNTALNCMRFINSNGFYVSQGNHLLMQPAATPKGIGLLADQASNRIVAVDSDPTSGTYRQTLGPAANMLQVSAMPSTGTWAKYTFVTNSAQVLASTGLVLKGWFRLTDGSSNVAGTDWVAIYASTGSTVGAADSAGSGYRSMRVAN